MKYRLGMDIGTNSVGWWIYELQDGKVMRHVDGGSRIFSDGRDSKSKASLAEKRRIARQIRRQRDRFIRRQLKTVKLMAKAGLLPENPEDGRMLHLLNPYVLRTRALNEKLDLQELGRAILHLAKRRGYRSNRMVEGAEEQKEAGQVESAIVSLQAKLKQYGARTFGEYLHMISGLQVGGPDRNHSDVSLRVRKQMTINDKGKDEERFAEFPSRQIIEDEFLQIWQAQSEFHKELTPELYEKIFDAIFFQRPLKPAKLGRCLYVGNETRLQKWHPLFQRRRLYETVNNIRIFYENGDTKALSKDQRDAIILAANDKKTLTLVQIRKLLKLSPYDMLNLETLNRKEINGDEIRAIMNHKTLYDGQWSNLALERQIALIDLLINEPDPEIVRGKLANDFGEKTAELADALMGISAWPKGTGDLGETATAKILAHLEAEVITYSEAASREFDSHSSFATGEIFENLPYYGEVLPHRVIPGEMEADAKKDPAKHFGRISNPTVHIALGQIRKIVNALIKRYGVPEQIVVEIGRNLKNSKARKKQIQKDQNENIKNAKLRSEKLDGLNVEDNGYNRMRIKVWESLGEDASARACPYCGKSIGIRMALNLSARETDIDHILPYSSTLDDGFANKTMCCSTCNAEKGNQTPYEAWGGDPERWDGIMGRIRSLNQAQRKRFTKNALQDFADENKFLASQLTDMQYISRVAHEYLAVLYPQKDERHVWVVPGRLTAMLRRHWGLNSILNPKDVKDRNDHRHHTIDALVIGATDCSLINAISKASGRNEDLVIEKIEEIPEPFEGFREGAEEIINKIMVSHRPDHGKIIPGQTTGQLHNKKAYGVLEYVEAGTSRVVMRRPIAEIKPTNLDNIVNAELREYIKFQTKGLTEEDFKKKIKEIARGNNYKGMRAVRMAKNLKVIPIRNASGKIYKAYMPDSNHCVEVWELSDGSWSSKLLSTFQANSKGLGSTRPERGAKLKMRLYAGDYVTCDKFSGQVAIIAKLSNSISMYFPHEANVDTRNSDKKDPLSYITLSLTGIKKQNLRKVGVDILGRIKMPQ